MNRIDEDLFAFKKKMVDLRESDNKTKEIKENI